MSQDKESRLLKVIDLLMEGTRDGSLEWEESFDSSYQTTLGGQSVVLERNPPYSIPPRPTPGMPGTAALEIRGKKGEVLERVEEPDLMQVPLGREFDVQQYSKTVTGAVDELYQLVANRKEAVANAAIDSLLGALQGRVRAK